MSSILAVGAIASIVSNRRRDAAAESAAASAVSGGWAQAGLTFEPPAPAADGEGGAASTAEVSQESAAAAVVGTVDAALPDTDIESQGRERQLDMQGAFDSASADPTDGGTEEAALPAAAAVVEGSAPGDGFSDGGVVEGVVEGDGDGGAGTGSAEAAGEGVAGDAAPSVDEGVVREDGGGVEASDEAADESAASVAGDAAAAAAAAAREKLEGLVGAEQEGEKAVESAAVGGEEGRQGDGS